MNELALFAGVGGGLLGSRLLGWRTVCYVEHDDYCIAILKARIKEGYLDDAPIWDDARTFNGKPWSGCVDIITAGFPCQPYSGMGQRRGEKDDRNLWSDTIRIIREIKPEWILLENVTRLLTFDYIRRIFGQLVEGGYDCQWDCIPGKAIGTLHHRDRLFVVAHAEHFRRSGNGAYEQERVDKEVEWNKQLRGYGADREMAEAVKPLPTWSTESDVCRVVDGFPDRMDRLRVIGNAQIPSVVEAAWKILTKDSA